jgi:uncharacterized protein (DUF2236 family)
MHEMMVEPLSEAEKDQLLRGNLRFISLFGIPERYYPTSWKDFQVARAHHDGHRWRERRPRSPLPPCRSGT